MIHCRICHDTLQDLSRMYHTNVLTGVGAGVGSFSTETTTSLRSGYEPMQNKEGIQDG